MVLRDASASNNSGSNSLRESSASCEGLGTVHVCKTVDTLKTQYFNTTTPTTRLFLQYPTRPDKKTTCLALLLHLDMLEKNHTMFVAAVHNVYFVKYIFPRNRTSSDLS